MSNKNLTIMKYKLTEETMTTDSGVELHRIECVTAFSDVKVGDKGGWIEKEENLSLTDQPTLLICPFTQFKHVVSEPACDKFKKR